MSRNSVGRELCAGSVDVRLHVVGVEPQLLDLDLVTAPWLRVADSPPGGCADAGGKLFHRERLHEVIVCADLERVDAVVLGATC